MLYAALTQCSASKRRGAFDEFIHVAGGYTYWAFNDYRLHPESSNRAQRIVRPPAYIEGARFPSGDNPAWRSSDLWVVGDEFFFASGNDADRLLGQARLMRTLESALLALLVFGWSRQSLQAGRRLGQPDPIRVQPRVPGARRPRDIRHDATVFLPGRCGRRCIAGRGARPSSAAASSPGSTSPVSMSSFGWPASAARCGTASRTRMSALDPHLLGE